MTSTFSIRGRSNHFAYPSPSWAVIRGSGYRPLNSDKTREPRPPFRVVVTQTIPICLVRMPACERSSGLPALPPKRVGSHDPFVAAPRWVCRRSEVGVTWPPPLLRLSMDPQSTQRRWPARRAPLQDLAKGVAPHRSLPTEVLNSRSRRLESE